MTDPQPDSTTQPSDPSVESAPSETVNTAQVPNSLSAAENSASTNDLPEWEPLTPELVEDEAIRGDFMLRWAVVLLTLLFGCRQIVETASLVLIRSGDVIRSNGFWPPSQDVLSFTANDRRWVNLSWLFDVTLSVINAVAGPMGLSIAVGLCAAVAAYWVVHLSRRQMPTWWTAVCAAAAVLAIQVDFAPLPSIVTVLGVAWTLKQLMSWSETRQDRSLWCIAGSLAVWSNLDGHAWIGWLLLLSFGLGTSLNGRTGRADALSAQQQRSWMKACGAGLVALMINPFGWHALLSPVRWYGIEIPAMKQMLGRTSELQVVSWESLFSPAVWTSPSLTVVMSSLLLLTAFVTTWMNRRRCDLAWLCCWLVTMALGVICVRDLTPLIIVSAILSALNGQDWYRAHCRQEYSIATWEVLYSRAGRAITVIGLLVVAYSALSGRLMGRDGKRVGVGLSPALAAAAQGTIEDLRDLPEARVFTFRSDQGDLAIWAGQKSFIDSRAGLFADGEDLLALHEQARVAIRRPEVAVGRTAQDAKVSADERRKVWQEILHRFQVTHVAPRLFGNLPAYGSFTDLATSPEWRLVKLGSTLAAFRETSELGTDKPVDFAQQVFDECAKSGPNQSRAMWPQPKTGYQQFLSLSATPVSNSAQRSRHALKLLESIQQGRLQTNSSQTFALAIMAVREAQAAVTEDPQNVGAYVYLADAYAVLGVIEAQICAAGRMAPPNATRQMQSLGALQLASSLEPDNTALVGAIAARYAEMRKPDLAMATMISYKTLVNNSDTFIGDDWQRVRQFNEYIGQIEPLVTQVEQQIAQALEQKMDRLQIASATHNQGFPLRALKVLEEDQAYLASNPVAQLKYAIVLLECGRFEESASRFDMVNSMGIDALQTLDPWQLHAATLATLMGDYDRAESWCRQRLRAMELATCESLLATSPLMSAPPELVKAQSLWPFQHVAAVSQTMGGASAEIAAARWMIAMCQLENARCKDSLQTLKLSLQHDSDPAFRLLTAEAIGMITRQRVDAIPASETIPILFEDGPTDGE